jgi:hypothetical protein
MHGELNINHSYKPITMKVFFHRRRTIIRLLAVILLAFSVSAYSQNAEFELACRIIKSIHSNGKLKEIIINDKVAKGDFD